jgi:hypothetical protein
MVKPIGKPLHGRTVAVRLDDALYEWLVATQGRVYTESAVSVSLSQIIRGLLRQARDADGANGNGKARK